MKEITFDIHGEQKNLPKLLITINLILVVLFFLTDFYNDIDYSIIYFSVAIIVISLARVFVNYIDSKYLWNIEGKLKLSENSILLGDKIYPLETIENVYFYVSNFKGKRNSRGHISDGSKNKIQITTNSKTVHATFIVDTVSKANAIKTFCNELNEKNIPATIDGIDFIHY